MELLEAESLLSRHQPASPTKRQDNKPGFPACTIADDGAVVYVALFPPRTFYRRLLKLLLLARLGQYPDNRGLFSVQGGVRNLELLLTLDHFSKCLGVSVSLLQHAALSEQLPTYVVVDTISKRNCGSSEGHQIVGD